MDSINPNFETKKEHAEDLLDEALEETFPASDPISPALPRNRIEAANDINKNVKPQSSIYSEVLQHKVLVISAVIFAALVAFILK